jgi:restriction system protein
MARRSSFVGTLSQIQREADRYRAAQLRADQAAARAAERAQREYERAQAATEKERQRLYVEARLAEVEADNENLQQTVRELQSLLVGSLTAEHAVDFALLRHVHRATPFDPGELAIPAPPPHPTQFLPPPPVGVSRHLPHVKKQHLNAQVEGQAAYEAAVASHAEGERQRLWRFDQAKTAHDVAQVDGEARVTAHNARIDSLEQTYRKGQADGLISYVGFVLERSFYPESFPHESRLAYVPEPKQLVVELELPPLSVVPDVVTYKYVKSGDKRTETARPMTQRRQLYTSVVAQVALRTVYEVFSADQAGHIDTIVLNGHVNAIDPGTGQAVRPCLITVRTTRDALEQLDLSKVDPAACLKALGAGVSKSPAELAPVRPVLEFSMVDPRFIEEQDVLSELDERPNLMELSPSEFESLISNLFQKMGLDTKLTQASRDGGVDCVAYDPRPVLGGKVVIQAKRYKNTVGVSAVRDLFGTMHNEGATKGILVTTSHYGKSAYEFAVNKPLELLDGPNLLYLLTEYAGISAKIEPPEDWVDPRGDE